MKILYLHGLGSGANANTACKLTEYFANQDIQILAPELPIMPKDAFSFILDIQLKEQPNIIIGASLGGLYARFLHGPFKILINPAFAAEDVIKAVGYGTHSFFIPRQTGELVYQIDETFVSQLQEIIDSQSKFFDDELRAETFALFGTKDKVISNYEKYFQLYRSAQLKLIDAEHRLSDKNISENLIPLIEELRSLL